jgi:hypothetical protein
VTNDELGAGWTLKAGVPERKVKVKVLALTVAEVMAGDVEAEDGDGQAAEAAPEAVQGRMATGEGTASGEGKSTGEGVIKLKGVGMT